MLLAIDVGNTSTTFGLFDGEKLVKQWFSPTAKVSPKSLASSTKNQISSVFVCSVVPEIDRTLKVECRKLLGVEPFFVTAENIPVLKIKFKNKKEIGADRVVDALAAYKLYGGPCIIVDFGTATTFDVISSKGEYLGGAIAPGITLARDALYHQTAKLPKVEIKAPKNIIGKDTVSAMQSGLVYGYVAMVEGMVEKIKSEILNPKSEINPKAQNSKFKIIATGGYAKLICKYTTVVDTIDQELTLKGLQMIGEMNALAF